MSGTSVVVTTGGTLVLSAEPGMLVTPPQCPGRPQRTILS